MVNVIAILAHFGIIGAAMGYSLGLVSYRTINSLMVNIISPVIDILLGSSLSSLKFKIFGINLMLGNFLISIIDFILVVGIILLLSKYVFNKLIIDVINHKKGYEEEVVSLLRTLIDWKIPRAYDIEPKDPLRSADK